MANVEITLGKPVIIAQSNMQAKGHHWGPYQFPNIQVNDAGEWICNYNVVEDAASGYGKPCGYAVSTDHGKTWISSDPSVATGLLLPNGDYIRQKSQYAIPADQVPLPAEPLHRTYLYGGKMDIYRDTDFPAELRGWYLERKRAGSDIWEEEHYFMDVPDLARYTNDQELFPYLSVTHYRIDPKGRLWHVSYPYFLNGDQPATMRPLFAVSEDNGHTFRYVSNIPYHPIPEADPKWDRRCGYNEPELCFLPDGSMLALLRITAGLDGGDNIAPMHIAYSNDDGKNWSTPEFFDDLGVYPNLLVLKNGVTLTTYGRPGLYVRATADPAGKVWDDRVTIIQPRPNDTCSYTTLLPIDDCTAYMVYSNFQEPNPEGIPVKTIMGRTITTKLL